MFLHPLFQMCNDDAVRLLQLLLQIRLTLNNLLQSETQQPNMLLIFTSLLWKLTCRNDPSQTTFGPIKTFISASSGQKMWVKSSEPTSKRDLDLFLILDFFIPCDKAEASDSSPSAAAEKSF